MPTLDAQHTSYASAFGISSIAAARYRSMQFLVSANGPCTQVDLYLNRVGTGGNDMNLWIYDDSSNSPNNAISDATVVDSSAISNGGITWYQYSITNCDSLVSGNKYWIVIGRATEDGSNYIEWGKDTNTYADGISMYGGLPPTTSQTADMDFKEYYDVSGPGGIASLSGVAKASIASMDTVAIGSITSINTVT